MGVSLSVLLHVTVAVLAITGLYQVVERFTRSVPRAATVLACVGMVAALVWFVVAVIVTR